jgi:hypothetical protein
MAVVFHGTQAKHSQNGDGNMTIILQLMVKRDRKIEHLGIPNSQHMNG